jgi:hypothetical protein
VDRSRSMTNPTQSNKRPENDPAPTPPPKSSADKSKGKKGGDEDDDLGKIVWDGIGPLP